MNYYNGDFCGVIMVCDNGFGDGKSIIEFVWTLKVDKMLIDGVSIPVPQDRVDKYEKRNMKLSDSIDHPMLCDTKEEWLAWFKKEGVIFNNTPKE